MRQKVLFVILALLTGYGVWSFYVASRYQSLCQLSYWRSTPAELRSCDELKTELQDR